MSRERGNNRDLNMLSAYMDGTLKENQRERLIFRLEREPELCQWLDNLLQTKSLLKRLPRLRAPHNFTLSQEMATVRSLKKLPVNNLLRLASSLAAVLMVVLLGVEYLFVEGRLSARTSFEAPMMEAASEAAPEPLIQWEGQSVDGGGSDRGVEGMGEGAPVIEMPMEESEAIQPEAEIEPVEEEEPLTEVQDPTPLEKRLDQETNEAESFKEESDTEDELILGINPDQAGDIIDSSESTKVVEGVPLNWQKVIRWMQITLAVIALSCGLALWLLHRKRKS